MGIIFDIQKFSVHDGPGIRTTVFLKGCNIRCLWCHNPESFVVKPQLSYEKGKCIQCGACVRICPNGVHTIVEGKHAVDYKECVTCGKCIEACTFQCMKIFGRETTAQEVMKEVVKDRKYYESSGGGITISGGEPSVQYEFLIELLQLSKGEELHICLETNGMIGKEKFVQIAKYVDLFLIDYKATGEDKHMELTGQSNKLTLKNIEYLAEIDKPVILRCPIIPGINDTENHILEIKRIKNKYSNIQNAEIMAYHSLGKGKWDAIGEEYSLRDILDVDWDKKKEWEEKIL